jgi:hypothetical protein
VQRREYSRSHQHPPLSHLTKRRAGERRSQRRRRARIEGDDLRRVAHEVQRTAVLKAVPAYYSSPHHRMDLSACDTLILPPTHSLLHRGRRCDGMSSTRCSTHSNSSSTSRDGRVDGPRCVGFEHQYSYIQLHRQLQLES